MNKNKRFLLLLIPVLAIVFLFVSHKSAHANVLDGIVTAVKNVIAPEKREMIIDSKIALAPEGDIDKNGQIDAGDIVRFTYVLNNKTEKPHAFATLKTNIDRKQLNFIHNITGTTSLSDDGKTVTIPNLRLAPNQIVTISFDARVNYFTDKDPLLTTEAELVGSDKKSIVKAAKKELQVKRIKKEKIPGVIKPHAKKEVVQE